MSEQYDVVIVGGGMVGTSLAVALGGSDLRVAVVESRVPETEWSSLQYDSHVCALTPATRDWLADLSVWPFIEEERYAPFQRVRVWDSKGTADIHFSAAEIGTDHLGYIVENRVALKSLISTARTHDNIAWFCPDSVTALETNPPTLKLNSGIDLTARLVVGADGAQSRIRQLGGFSLAEWDYGHSAIVTSVRAEQPHGGRALHRFSSDGPLAFLPLPDIEGSEPGHCYSIVWCDSPDRIHSWLKLGQRELCSILEREFESQVGAIEWIAPCTSLALRHRHALGYVREGIALIGDAAHTIHPLAGQGANLGFQDARALAGAVLDAAAGDREIGGLWSLNRFQLRRIGPNVAMSGLMEGFKQIFAQTDPRIRWLRNLGIRFFDQHALLKKEVVRMVLGV